MHVGDGLPPTLLGLSDIILAKDSHRSMSQQQHGTENGSTKHPSTESSKSYFDSDRGNLLIQIPSHIASSANTTQSNDSITPSSSQTSSNQVTGTSWKPIKTKISFENLIQSDLNPVEIKSKPVEPVSQESDSLETQSRVDDSESSGPMKKDSTLTIISSSPKTAAKTIVNPSLVIKTAGSSSRSRPSLMSSILTVDTQTQQQEQEEDKHQIEQQDISGTVQEGRSLNRPEGASLKLAQYTLEDMMEPQFPVAMDTNKQTEAAPSSKATESEVVMATHSGSNSTSKAGMESGPKDSSVGTSSKRLSYNILDNLFTNWPCIVTTILGYYPVGQSTDGTSNQQQSKNTIGQLHDPNWSTLSHNRSIMSTVQSLDGFTTQLILNCSDSYIDKFTSTIVQKINSCLADESTQRSLDLIDINVHDIGLKLIDDKLLPIVVGKRFLNSVIRVLGMEHSRVKNMFVEMQHFRSQMAAASAANRQSEIGGEGQGARVWQGESVEWKELFR